MFLKSLVLAELKSEGNDVYGAELWLGTAEMTPVLPCPIGGVRNTTQRKPGREEACQLESHSHIRSGARAQCWGGIPADMGSLENVCEQSYSL